MAKTEPAATVSDQKATAVATVTEKPVKAITTETRSETEEDPDSTSKFFA